MATARQKVACLTAGLQHGCLCEDECAAPSSTSAFGHDAGEAARSLLMTHIIGLFNEMEKNSFCK